jgi:hypothetical protein
MESDASIADISKTEPKDSGRRVSGSARIGDILAKRQPEDEASRAARETAGRINSLPREDWEAAWVAEMERA